MSWISFGAVFTVIVVELAAGTCWTTGAVAATPSAFINVGPATTPSTIQGALDLVTKTDEPYLIRVQGGVTYTENLDITVPVGSSVGISGGWNDTFTSSTMSPSQTIIDGNSNRVLKVVLLGSASFSLKNFTVQIGGFEAGFFENGPGSFPRRHAA